MLVENYSTVFSVLKLLHKIISYKNTTAKPVVFIIRKTTKQKSTL